MAATEFQPPSDLELAAQDFYEFANRDWIKNNPLPPTEYRFGSFGALKKQTLQRIKECIETPNQQIKKELRLKHQLAADFFASGLNSGHSNPLGNQSLKSHLNDISKIQNISEVLDHLAGLHRVAITPVFRVFASNHLGNNEPIEAYILTANLPLKNLDYYWSNELSHRKIRLNYVNYIKDLFQISQILPNNPFRIAEEVFNFEKELANISLKESDYNPVGDYHLTPYEDLLKITPSLQWERFFSKLGILPPLRFYITDPAYLKKLNRLIDEIPISTWKNYLRYCWLRTVAPFLGEQFRLVHFNFFEGLLGGQREIKNLVDLVTESTSIHLADLIGELYVQRFFPEEIKDAGLDLTEKLKQAGQKVFSEQNWIDGTVANQIRAIVNSVKITVGFPNQIKDYSKLTFSKDSYLENVLKCRELEVQQNLSLIGEKQTSNGWDISPQEVNAYYHPQKNEIALPAALFQKPLFDIQQDSAANFGAIGIIIAHELFHAIQAKFNKKSSISPITETTINGLLSLLNDQIKDFHPQNHLPNSDAATIEDLADLGGILLALHALIDNNEDIWETEPDQQYNPIQRFFIAYAQIWAQNSSAEDQYRRNYEDIHADPRVRVNLPLRNIPEFIQAFNIKPGDPMYLPFDKQIRIVSSDE